jgi:di/tricarboxylate transporter
MGEMLTVALPGPHGFAVLALTVLALFLFTRDRIPIETSSILVLTLLVLGFQLFPYADGGERVNPTDFFLGFGHEALITIGALMVAGKALETTGALQPLAMSMARAWAARPHLAMLGTLIMCALLSAFLNNTPIVVMLLPLLISISLRRNIPSSKLLMPMNFATLLGGMGTTIGTSTNLLVVAISADLGMRRFEMFDFTLPVLIVGSVGILFLWLVAPRLIPERDQPLMDTSPRIYKAMLFVNKDSWCLGKTLAEIRERTEKRMTVNRIQRGDGLYVAKLPSMRLQEGDRLLISDTRENLKEYERLLGVSMNDVVDGDSGASGDPSLAGPAQQLAEVVVTSGSPLHRRTLNTTQFRTRHKLMPLAIHRARTGADELTGDFEDVILRAGDVILVQGSNRSISELRNSGSMLVLDGTVDLPHTRKAPLAMLIMTGIVAAAATGLVPIAVSALVGATLMIMTGCLNWRDVAGSLSTSVILLIVVSLALGDAILKTGGDEFLSDLFVYTTSGLQTWAALSLLMLTMAVLTNIVSNNAAAVIGTPVALGIATKLGAAPEAFVLAVIFGSNMSYATPTGYQTNLLVFSAGGYKFTDFMRVGIPLTLVMWVGFTLVLSWMYGLF